MCVAKHMAGQIPYSLVPKIDVPGLLQYILLEFIWTVPLIVKQLQVSLTLVIAFLFQQSIIFYEFILYKIILNIEGLEQLRFKLLEEKQE